MYECTRVLAIEAIVLTENPFGDNFTMVQSMKKAPSTNCGICFGARVVVVEGYTGSSECVYTYMFPARRKR